jgi:prolyl oligopeptidase
LLIFRQALLSPITVAALIVSAGLCEAARVGAAAIPPPPTAPIEPVVDDYFGTRVTDNYRWMEDRSAPRFVEWIKGENEYARAVLAAIPNRDILLRRVASHSAGGVVVNDVRLAGRRMFYLKRAPGEESFRLYGRDSGAGAERVLVNPDRLASAGHHFAIDYYEPSADGRRVAYGLSHDGSEDSVIHVIETDTLREAPETIDRAEYGSPNWRSDGRSFFYNRFAKLRPGAAETEKYLNSRAYLHVLGSDPEHDVAMIGTNLTGDRLPITPVDVPFIATAAGSSYEFAVISHGADPAVTLYVAASKKNPLDDAWLKVADAADGVTDFAVHGRKLYLLTHKDAARYKVIQTDVSAPDLTHAKTVIAAGERVVERIAAAADGLYVRDLDAGQGRIRKLDYDTDTVGEVAPPVQGTISGPVTDSTRAGAVFSLQGWVSPEHFYRVSGGAVTSLDLMPPWGEDLSPYSAEEVRVSAADGAQIPLSIVYKKGLKLDGRNPLWLTGYGAYGIALKPRLLTRQLTLLDDGGVYAVAHVRGGGEFGEDWHRAGFMATKPNTYRDLIACAEYLIQHGYASAASTAIEGRSGPAVPRERGRDRCQHRHAHGHAVVHLFANDGARSVGHLGGDFHAAVHRTGVHDEHARGGQLQAFGVQAEIAEIGGVVERRALCHALLLDAQHHHHVGAGDAVLDAGEALRAAKFTFGRQQRFGRDQPHIRRAQRGQRLRAERATRECLMSPTMATLRPAKRRLCVRMVRTSSSPWVGCDTCASPALITETCGATWSIRNSGMPASESRITNTSVFMASSV